LNTLHGSCMMTHLHTFLSVMASKDLNPPIQAQSRWDSKFETLGTVALGAILVTLPLFFWINTHDQFELPKLTLLRLLSVSLVGCWAAFQAMSPVWRWRRSPLDLPVLAWSAWLLFKTLNSVSSYVSWRGEYENFCGSLTQLNYSLLFYLTVQLARSAPAARKLMLAFELSCLAVGIYALFQALQLDFISWSATSVVTDRFFASMGNPNFLGALMIMGLALVLARALDWELVVSRGGLWWHWICLAGLPLVWLACFAFGPREHAQGLIPLVATGQPGAKVVAGLYLLGLLAMVVLIKVSLPRIARYLALALEGLILFKALADTGTRGALAGLMATLGFFAVAAVAWLWKKLASRGYGPWKRAAFALGSLALLFAALTTASFSMGPELSRRMKETLGDPLHAFDASRMNIWGPALHIARDFPLTGTGVDTFKTVFPQYAYSRFAHYDGENVASRTAHCEPLQILATLGSIGLALWIWLIGAWGKQWWKRYSQASSQDRPWIMGLGGLFVGYLVQNLVSFGVSAITAPFFICMGLLWAGVDLPARRLSAAKARPWVLAACLIWLALGSWAATAAFRADSLYNFGFLVSSQNELLDHSGQPGQGVSALEAARAGIQECGSAAQFALNELSARQGPIPQAQQKESADWLAGLKDLESKLNSHAIDETAALPYYRRAAKTLLMVLSSLRQEDAVALCPSEVKYQVYLGLAYEELYKLSTLPQQRQIWFDQAEQAYLRGSQMNPRNAYYHGNLGRLYSLRSEEGDAAYTAKAERNYFDAIALAPSTKLFYENMILLYSQTAKVDAGLNLLRPLETREPDLAGQLYLSMGTTFYQGSQDLIKDKPKSESLKQGALEALERASHLNPGDANVPYVIGAIHFNEKNTKLAKEYMLKALAIDPKMDFAKQFLQAHKL
jgi:tetratricopeptide (TPR) repeat protein